MACRLAVEDERVVAVTGAMSEGTGLVTFAREHPERFFDVGIAEAHAVTFSAGMATEGMRPIAAIDSTVLQRAYDQIIHDVALQHLPVIFCIDRAGLVGEDGPTHHGGFDLAYLRCIPEIVLAAPKDARELCDLMVTALRHDAGPFAIRYPRDTVPDDLDLAAIDTIACRPLEIGSWERLREGTDVVLLAVGSMVDVALSVAPQLEAMGGSVGVVNCRFVKPMDEQMLDVVFSSAARIVTLEEGSLDGGFGSAIASSAHDAGATCRILHIGLPDRFIDHGKRGLLLERASLSVGQVFARIAEWRIGGPSVLRRQAGAAASVSDSSLDAGHGKP
jgi:1-deoxy-D-xylulose-5-phosphate synthase